MPDRFTLTVDLGNEAMRTPLDVRDALASALGAVTFDDDGNWYVTEGTFRDVNGNTVGRWEVS